MDEKDEAMARGTSKFTASAERAKNVTLERCPL